MWLSHMFKTQICWARKENNNNIIIWLKHKCWASGGSTSHQASGGSTSYQVRVYYFFIASKPCSVWAFLLLLELNGHWFASQHRSILMAAQPVKHAS